ncbi:MAG: peptide chain release factor N(5)-glutamine methyltransferase [Clostridia bacterium]|nr:peptide chain release factor N(5)-glutamine methyltransferase [Clostridia bacterium]
MATIRETLRSAAARLAAAGAPIGDHDAAMLLSHVLGEDMLMMKFNAHRELAQADADAFEALLARRKAREPLQYILGETGFMGLTFCVTPSVLIPRPDTEILCEEAIRRIGKRALRVLDIGTGSGALAVSIAHHCENAQVTAVDISADALGVAKENAARNGAGVRFLLSDCFGAVAGETFDVIVSNPPYISDEEMRTLEPEVLSEPHLALRADNEGLAFYERICREACERLAPGGCLLFEIGWKQKDAVSALVKAHIGEPFALKDYGDNWRVVGAVKA